MSSAPPPDADPDEPDERLRGRAVRRLADEPDESRFRLFGKGAPPSPGLTMLADLMNNHLDPGYAAAARRRETGEPPSRLANRGRSVLTLVCAAVIGLVLAAAYRETAATAPDTTKTRDALIAEVRKAQNDTDALQRSADERRKQVAAAQDAAVADGGTGQTLSRKVREAEALTGLSTVRGPGVVLQIADGEPTKDPVTGSITSDPQLSLVQDSDLQAMVNAVWAAGAEAVAIDGQRLTALSTIRSAGAAILVDFRPVDNPYTIIAVGSSDRLYRNLLRSVAVRQFQSYVKDYKMGFDLRRDDTLRLGAGPEPDLHAVRTPTATPTPTAGRTPSPGTSTGAAASTPPPNPTPASPSPSLSPSGGSR